MKKITLYLIAVSAFFGSVFNGKTVYAQCTDTLAVFSGNPKGTAKFNAVKYFYGSGWKASEWLYTVESFVSGSSAQRWSHINLQLGTCLPSSMFDVGGIWSGTPSNYTKDTNTCWVLGKDGSDPSKTWGLKHTCPFDSGTYKIWFRLKSDYAVSSNKIKVKGGKNVWDSTQYLCGPDNQCGPVPVKFGFISGENDGVKDIIKFTTFTEIRNDTFILQRSYGDGYWLNVGGVKGSGNSYQKKEYQIEVTPNYENGGKTRYYRVMQIDFDGAYDYSPIVKISSEPTFGFYPNPAQEGQPIIFNYNNFDEGTTLCIFDQIGQELFSKEFTGSNIFQIDNLAKGLYNVMIYGRHNHNTEKLIIK